MGWKGSCLVGWPVAASAARVRPWKLPSALTTTWRPRPPNFRATLNAASLASAPELQKKTWPPPPSSSSMAMAVSVATGLAKKFDTCSSVRACSATASATTGWACPSDVTAKPPRKSR